MLERRPPKRAQTKEAASESEEIAARGHIESPAHVVTVMGLRSLLRSEPLARTDKVVVFLTPYESKAGFGCVRGGGQLGGSLPDVDHGSFRSRAPRSA